MTGKRPNALVRDGAYNLKAFKEFFTTSNPRTIHILALEYEYHDNNKFIGGS
jgi:hypothetical protein